MARTALVDTQAEASCRTIPAVCIHINSLSLGNKRGQLLSFDGSSQKVVPVMSAGGSATRYPLDTSGAAASGVMITPRG